jgi:hypothetical protein
MTNDLVKPTPFSMPAKNAFWVLVLGYLCITLFNIPRGIEIGLDPSWRYGLSHAAERSLVFGKEIIFTYGPLGFLVEGAALKQNLLPIVAFRFLIHLGLFILFFLKLLSLKGSLHRAIFSFSFLFAYFVGLSTEYEIVCIWVLLLSLTQTIRKKIRAWALGLGCLAGFLFLTKFTLGVYSFGSLVLFLLVELCQAIRAKSNVKPYLLAGCDSLFSMMAIATIFVIPAATAQSLMILLIGITISAAAGSVSYLIYQYKFQNKTGFKATFLGWVVFYGVYCSYLLTQVSYVSLLLNFLSHSLEIAQGYSSAMSTVGNPDQLRIAVAIAFLLIILMCWLAKQKQANLAMPLCFILFLSFKHSFVRQDIYHVVNYFALVPIILSISASKIDQSCFTKRINRSYIGLVFSILALNIYLGISPILDVYIARFAALDFESSLLFPTLIYQRILDPSQFVRNASFLLNINSLERYIQETSLAQLMPLKMPEPILQLLGNKTVDVIPWEISMTAANQLNWQPRPIFQSYSAYTERLDSINFDSLKNAPRDYLLYSFSAIDGRHPFFDEPQAFSYVFCHYIPVSQVAELNLIVLRRSLSSRCAESHVGEVAKISWGQPYPISVGENEVLRAKIHIHYSFLGKFYKAIFRIPPVFVIANYGDSQNLFRIIPENSGNGVIISNLPRDSNKALSFLEGNLSSDPIKSFSLHTNSQPFYQPTVEISIESEKVRQ